MKIFPNPSEKAILRRTQAFTLVELLVVIAIIGILAAILFPVFSRARENARRSSCQSNMKQLGLGFLQYAQDFDEKLPEGEEWLPGNPFVRGFAWANRIYPYVKSSQIYICPSVKTPYPLVSYIYNGAITRDIQANNAGLGWLPNNKLAKFNAVSKTVMLMEGVGSTPGDPSLPRSAPGGDPSEYGNGYGYEQYRACINCQYSGVLDGVPDAVVAARPSNWATWPVREGHHLEGINFLAVDGHVKWLKTSAVSAGDNAASAQTVQVSGTVSNTGTAEGTGVGIHAMTMSVN